jgi:alanine racemase
MSALTRVSIDLDAIRSNVRVLRTLAGAAEVAAVVKANAYGLGAAAVARAALDAGAGRLCVFSLDEAESLRDAHINAAVLILGPTLPRDAARSVALDVALTVTRPEAVEALARAAADAGRPMAVHVKVDSGMYRLGLPPAEAVALADAVQATPSLRLEGFCTHFPSADEPDEEDTRRRFDEFRSIARHVQAPIQHVANTATLLRFPEMALDMVRVGAGLYGFACGELEAAARTSLQPVLTWEAPLVQIHDVPAGASVCYGGRWTAPADSRVGVVAVGYADGYRRALSNRGTMLVRGRRVPVVGVVCMDLTLVDLSGAPDAAVGDVMTLVGAGGGESIRLEEVAGAAGTIPYDILTGLGPRPDRVYRSAGTGGAAAGSVGASAFSGLAAAVESVSVTR